MAEADLEIRRAERADDAGVVALLRVSLNKDDDPDYEAFLDWKHRRNAFGESPAWVALDGDRVVGYRTLMRWRFVGDDGRRLA